MGEPLKKLYNCCRNFLTLLLNFLVIIKCKLMRINATEKKLYVNIGTLKIKKSEKLNNSGTKY